MTRQTFVGKVISLSFNMLFRLDIAFLPRSKCLFTDDGDDEMFHSNKTQCMAVTLVYTQGLDSLIYVSPTYVGMNPKEFHICSRLCCKDSLPLPFVPSTGSAGK